jgi:hypothetical protein
LGKVFGEHRRADDLGVERQLQILGLEIGEFPPGTGRCRRHHMIDGTNAVGKAADGRVVGDVDGLGGNREAGVRVGELDLVAACDDNPRTFLVREQCHGTSGPE